MACSSLEHTMKTLRAIAVALLFAGFAIAQTSTAPSQATAVSSQAQQQSSQPAPPPPPKDTAKPEDVKSVEAITAALYDVISGPPGPRNWDRMRSLFAPDAHLIPTGKRPDGAAGFRILTVEDYVNRAGPMLEKEGFFERGIANKTETYGGVVHIFSTYESRHEKDGQPFARGINSIQMVYGWGRWWITSVAWDSERPENKIPEKYLK
jgi:hypothetical protein